MKLTSESAEVCHYSIRDIRDLDERGVIGLCNERTVGDTEASDCDINHIATHLHCGELNPEHAIARVNHLVRYVSFFRAWNIWTPLNVMLADSPLARRHTPPQLNIFIKSQNKRFHRHSLLSAKYSPVTTGCIPQTTFIDHKNISACHIYQQTLLLVKNPKRGMH